MISIRHRVILISTLTIVIVGIFGFLTYSAFRDYSSFNDQYEESYRFINQAFEAQNRRLEKKEIQALESRAPNLKPEFRAKALLNVLKNPSSANVQFLIRAETEYRRYLAPLIDYSKKRATYFGTVALSSALILSIFLGFIVIRQVLAPLYDLSKKMVDFLNNRYSYQFTIPAANEIGKLHATFNSMAQKVLTQIEELKSLDKAKSEFLSIASHELRTPLTSIKGSLSLLNSGIVGKINETALNLMTIALDETDRLIRLINELLDLAKIEARQFPLNAEWVAAHPWVEKTFASLQGLCQAASVQLAAENAQSYDVYIDADRSQQILTNLLSNAIKYSPKGETVTVRFIETEQSEICIEVQDRGRGIAPEDQEIIFEKFRQATNAQNPLVKGTGLGLAIAKALVEQHGGQIGVRSVPGEGSTFYFTLPKWRRHSPKAEAVA